MIIDRTHSRWMFAVTAIVAVATAGYVAYARTAPNGPSGGSVPGLLFGIAAAGLMVFAFLLALRRRALATRIGSAQFWLRGHVWLGALTVPLALFHSAGRFGGPVEQVLMATFAVVIVTGVYGLVVQHFLPRLMRLTIPHETFIEQIPFVSNRNLITCDQTVARCCGKLKIDNDRLVDVLRRTVEFAARLPSEDQKTDKWLEGVDPGSRELLKSLAPRAKDDQWFASPGRFMRGTFEFPSALKQIYAFNGHSEEVAAAPGRPEKEPEPAARAEKAAGAAGKPPAVAHVARKVPRPPADEASATPDPPSPAAEPQAASPQPPAKLSPAAAALQAKLAAKKGLTAGPEPGQNPIANASGTPVAVEAEVADPPPSGPPPAVGGAKLSPASAALQARLAARRKGAVPAASPVEPAVAAPPAESPKLSPAAAALQAKLAAKKQVATAGAAHPAPEAAPSLPAAQPAGTDSPPTASPAGEKPQLSAAAAALQAKLAAKKAGAAPAAPVSGASPPAAPAETPAAGARPVSAAAAALQAKLAAKKGTGKPSSGGGPDVAASAPAAQPDKAAPPPRPERPVAAAKVAETAVPQRSIDRLKEFYLTEARPYLRGAAKSSPLAVLETSKRMFALLRRELASPLHDPLNEIESYCDERRELLQLQRLHRQLHWWLAIHVPVSVVVMVLMIVHIVTALRVVPF